MVAGLTDAENLHGHSTASIARLIRRVVGYGSTGTRRAACVMATATCGAGT